MKKRQYNYIYVFIGLVLLGVGLYLTKSVANPQGVMRALPYVMIGLGCGIFGQGMGDLIQNARSRTAPRFSSSRRSNKRTSGMSRFQPARSPKPTT